MSSDLLLQLLALPILGAGLWLGYRRWVSPRALALTTPQQTLLVLIILTLIGGFAGAPFWWLDVQRSFAWDLPPLASRMLAAAGLAFGVACIFALEQPTPQRTRLIVVMLTIYLLPLAAAIVLFHLDYFDFTAPITYAFFIVAVGMALVSVYLLIRFPKTIQEPPAEDTLPPLVRGWLMVVLVATGLWGLALFITDSGPSPLIWAWPGDLLASRLIGVMLLTIAAMSLAALNRKHVARQTLASIIVYGVGLMLASLWNALFGLPVKWSYAAVFGMISLVSALIYVSHLTQKEPAL